LDQLVLQEPQDLVVQTELLAQQDLLEQQAHKDLLVLLAHKGHLEQKVTREIQEHKVFQ
jgi:hypothetical protein